MCTSYFCQLDSVETIIIGNISKLTLILSPPPSQSSDKDPYVVKRCLYVQQYMGTEVMLVGSENLHKNHSVLNSLVSRQYCSV